MAIKDYLFTSESVSEGHPDKVCDQISDAILDAFIANDVKLGHADDSHANTRLGCETLATTNKIVIAGEGRASDLAVARTSPAASACYATPALKSLPLPSSLRNPSDHASASCSADRGREWP